MPSLIYQLQQAASSTGIDFRNLVLASAGAGAAAPAPVAAATAVTNTGTGAAAAAAAPAAAAVLPPGVTLGPAGLPIEPFTFTFNGNFFHLANFFGRLERFVVVHNQHLSVSGRLLSLNAISLSPGPKGFPQITAIDQRDDVPDPAVAGAGQRSSAGHADDRLRPARREHRFLLTRNRRGGHRTSPMTNLKQILTELREKRLWPVAVVLLVALIAVPTLLAKSSTPTPVAQLPQSPASAAAAAAIPAVSVETTPTNSNLKGHSRDPFLQQKLAAAAKAASTSTTKSSTTTTTTTSTTSTHINFDGYRRSGGSSTGGSTTVLPLPRVLFYRFATSLRFGILGSRLRTINDVGQVHSTAIGEQPRRTLPRASQRRQDCRLPAQLLSVGDGQGHVSAEPDGAVTSSISGWVSASFC